MLLHCDWTHLVRNQIHPFVLWNEVSGNNNILRLIVVCGTAFICNEYGITCVICRSKYVPFSTFSQWHTRSFWCMLAKSKFVSVRTHTPSYVMCKSAIQWWPLYLNKSMQDATMQFMSWNQNPSFNYHYLPSNGKQKYDQEKKNENTFARKKCSQTSKPNTKLENNEKTHSQINHFRENMGKNVNVLTQTVFLMLAIWIERKTTLPMKNVIRANLNISKLMQTR